MEIGISLGIQRGGGLSAIARAMATIDALSPTAWYHMRGSGVPTASGGFASMWPDMADTDNGLVLPGVAGNYASAPAIASQINGDHAFECLISLADVTPATPFYPLGNSSSNTGAIFGINSSGYPILVWGTGAAYVTMTSTALPTWSDNTYLWFKATLDINDGSGNRVATFYTAPYSNGSERPSSWTTLSTVTTAGTTTVAPLASGILYVGNSFTVGSCVRRALAYSDLGTTCIFDADFSVQAKGTTSFTESSSNAATVTVNQSGALPAHIGNKKDLLQGTGTNQPAYSAGVITFDGVDNYLKTNAFTLNQPTTVYFVGNPISWTNGDVIFGSQSGTAAYARQDTSTPQIEAYAGTASTNDANFAVGSYAVLSVVFNGANSVLQINNNSAVTGDFGAGVLGGLTLGAAATPASYFNGAFKECVVFAAAHDATQRASVISALNTLNTVF